jgi:DNA-binding phage protein
MTKIQKNLKEIIAKERISIYRIAKDLGLDYSTLHKSLNKGNPTAKTIEKIANYLGYEVRAVIARKKKMKR